MCWPVDSVLYNFNHFSIAINAPAQYGVYALFDDCKKVLLIDSGEVQRDLLRLAEGADAELCAANPVFFSFVLAAMAECEGLKQQLVCSASFDRFAEPVRDVKGPHRGPSSMNLNQP